MVENLYRVPKKTWKRWTKTARRVFNLTMDETSRQDMLLHPLQPRMHPQHWEAIRWNIAWTAAHELSKSEKDE